MRDTLTITDNRTGKKYEIPITKSTIRAVDLRQIKIDPDEFGMMSYDPAFLNTAACRSRITFVDGDNGVLLHRGYPIEQLAEHSTFVETAYLLLNGELPTQAQLDRWTQELKLHTMLRCRPGPVDSAWRAHGGPRPYRYRRQRRGRSVARSADSPTWGCAASSRRWLPPGLWADLSVRYCGASVKTAVGIYVGATFDGSSGSSTV